MILVLGHDNYEGPQIAGVYDTLEQAMEDLGILVWTQPAVNEMYNYAEVDDVSWFYYELPEPNKTWRILQ